MLTACLIAYMGPGPGLAALGPLLALVGAAVMMAIGFVWYPVLLMRRLWRTWAARKADAEQRSEVRVSRKAPLQGS